MGEARVLRIRSIISNTKFLINIMILNHTTLVVKAPFKRPMQKSKRGFWFVKPGLKL